MLAALAPSGALVTLPASPPRAGLDARVFAGERCVALFRDRSAFGRLVEKRSALPEPGALPVDARLAPFPAREAAKRALAQGGPIVGAVLDPGAADAFRIARWELLRLAAGDVLAARAQRGAPLQKVALDAECLELVPSTPPPEALVSRLRRIAAQEREVAALFLWERRPLERARRAETKLGLGVACRTSQALPPSLVRRIFGEAVLDLVAPDEPLIVRRTAFIELDRRGRYREIEPLFRVRGLAVRIAIMKGVASIVNGIFAPRDVPRNPPRG